MFMKMLTHLHMVVYTWWCWHICKEKVLELILINLEKREKYFSVLRTLG